ncbi:MAG: hypothetical protein P4M05_21130 [Bradyrhizobium sp.]|nr:hypothetical protein [Bradyrhizobium sp.]
MSYMRYLKNLGSVLPIGFAVISAAPADAQGVKFGPDSDVLGLRTTMSRSEVESALKASYPGAQVTVAPVVVSIGAVQKKFDVALIVDLTSQADKQANQKTAAEIQAEMNARKAAGLGDSPLDKPIASPGDVVQDRLKVLLSQSEADPRILGVSRYVEYPADKQPVYATVLDALVAKYGPPTKVTGERVNQMTYTWGGAPRPGAKSLTDCSRRLFFDTVGEDGFYGMPALIDFTGQQFVKTMNVVTSKNPLANYEPCGLFLAVTLQFTKNPDYIGAMAVHLNDLSRIYAQLGAVGNGIAADADAAKKKKLDADAVNKPKL